MKFISQFNKLFFSLYTAFMLIFYVVYLWLDSYRFTPKNFMLSNNSPTESDFDRFSNLSQWTTNTGRMFLGLFLLTMVVCCYKRNLQNIKNFIITNIALFIGITIISTGVFFLTSSTFGNLIEPILIPIALLVLLVVYSLYLLTRKKYSQHDLL
ncbi:hypothetical protein AMD01_06690 [Priestia koreensis]|uniref:Uncharacterized protein n=1 Tax=Priestia koreensis TaxID=284581 RepID=A0A0M0L8H9_9BACI|nr:hypothetical protein AMD01_06690 [Priestia koreensis]